MRIITALLLALSVTAIYAQTEKEFRKLLQENDLVFTMPANFTETGVKKNQELYYNYAIKYEKDTFEIRYTIFSLESLFENYEKSLIDSNVSALDPNKFHHSMFMTSILNIAQSGFESMPQTSAFPEEAVKTEFSADYGSTSFFIANSGFAEGYELCLLMVLHKEDVADVYVSFLGNNMEKFEEYMLMAFYSIRFKD